MNRRNNRPHVGPICARHRRLALLSPHDGTWNKGDTASHGRTLRISGDGGGSARRQIPSSNHLRGRPDGCAHTRMHPGIDPLSGMSSACTAVEPTIESHHLSDDDAAARWALNLSFLRAWSSTQQGGLHERIDNAAGIMEDADLQESI